MPSDVALLRALRRAGKDPVRVADLAGQLGLTLTALHQRLRALRIAGFEFDTRSDLGLRLLAGPRDRLVADDLRARLPEECTVGREIVVLAETDSTNDVAARAGAGGAAEGWTVFVETQRAGRGRQGRRWSSERGLGLWFSILLRPRVPPERWSGLALLAALAVVEAAEAEAGVAAQIKWPNDVLVQGRKVSGILIEAHSAATRAEGSAYAIVGIGINVAHRDADFPEALRERAGSLAQAADRPVERAALAAAVLGRLETLYQLWLTDPAAIAHACSSRCHLRGQRVRAADDPQLEGVVEGFDAQGRLLLRRCPEMTEILTVASGEIVLLPQPVATSAAGESKTGSR